MFNFLFKKRLKATFKNGFDSAILIAKTSIALRQLIMLKSLNEDQVSEYTGIPLNKIIDLLNLTNIYDFTVDDINKLSSLLSIKYEKYKSIFRNDNDFKELVNKN